MKKFIFLVTILLFAIGMSFGQDNQSSVSVSNIIDYYFKAYNKEPEYRTTELTEEMMNNLREKLGVWGNPKFDKFMRQIKLYKTMKFKADKEHLNQVFKSIDTEIKGDKLYKPYFKWNNNDSKSYFYIRYKGSKIVEFVLITVAPDRGIFSVSSFNGDDIDIETIRSFTHDK